MAAVERFRDKVALVTGAASGIGLATVKRLASEGARVVLADLDARRLDAATADARAAGAPDALPAVCDVADESAVAAAVDGAFTKFGRLDAIVNNAGLMVFKPLEQQTEADWLKVLHVDLLGAFFFTKQAFLRMQPGGAIVNVSSIHAIETTPNVASYAAAKSAMVSLTRSAALEGKPRGIRVNVVLPGAVDTPMLWKNPNVVSGIEKVDPDYVGKPEDIAAVIAWLASDDAAFVQGGIVRADGGRLDKL